MLSKMTGQKAHLLVKSGKGARSRMVRCQAGFLQLSNEVERVWEIAIGKECGKPIHDIVWNVESFPNFPRGTASTIADHIGGHCRTMPAIAFINLLDYPFTAFPAGKININVRPCIFSSLTQEPFEQRVKSQWIHVGNPEA